MSFTTLLQVLVTGAGGRTGGLVYQQLLQRPEDFTPVGLVRSEKSAKKLGSDVKYVIGDIMDPASLETAVAGCDALVLLTSAAPQIKPLSLVKSIITKILPGVEAVRPEFDYPEGGSPEEVDWTGAKNQIDAAVKAGVKRIVFVGSMGGTQVDNFLNTMGNGNILLWKRKAEKYLVASGVPYTIIHPGERCHRE
eukprot:gene2797-3589_t